MVEIRCFAQSVCVCVCWHVLVMHCLVTAVMRCGQGRWDIGVGNGPYSYCASSSTGERWGQGAGEEGGKKS